MPHIDPLWSLSLPSDAPLLSHYTPVTLPHYLTQEVLLLSLSAAQVYHPSSLIDPPSTFDVDYSIFNNIWTYIFSPFLYSLVGCYGNYFTWLQGCIFKYYFTKNKSNGQTWVFGQLPGSVVISFLGNACLFSWRNNLTSCSGSRGHQKVNLRVTQQELVDFWQIFVDYIIGNRSFES